LQPFFGQLEKSFASPHKFSIENVSSNQLKPIFILGLPRSGSTLLEQMMANHLEIETAGEVNYLSSEVVTQLQKMTGKPYPLDIDKLSSKQYQQLGKIYLSELKKHHPNSEYIIDKLPSNFQSLGLIKRILPDAVVIHITRQPEAVAISIFANYFAENEPYFCDLNEFAEYYVSYKKLMDFWKEEQQDNFLEISYETLVLSPKKAITKLLESFGLHWQERCLDFHTNSRTITTLSSNQVRKPLYKSSLNQWKHYQEFLEDFTSKININN